MAGVLAYNPRSFNSLPEFSVAVNKFRHINGESLVANEIRRFFVANNMDTTFGLTLLHRHFNMTDTERLVERDGLSTPCDISENSEITSCLHPSLFRATDEGLLEPVEFQYVAKGHVVKNLTEDQVDFIKNLMSFLKEKKADDVFGLCWYPGDNYEGYIEKTEDRKNIQIKPYNYEEAAKTHAVTTGWYFSRPLWGNVLERCENYDDNRCEKRHAKLQLRKHDSTLQRPAAHPHTTITIRHPSTEPESSQSAEW